MTKLPRGAQLRAQLRSETRRLELETRHGRRIWPLREPAVVEAQLRLIALVQVGLIAPATAKICWRAFIRALRKGKKTSMKRTAPILALSLALALPAAASFTRIAGCSAITGPRSSSQTCTLNVSAGAQMWVVAAAQNAGSAPVYAPNDTAGNSFAPINAVTNTGNWYLQSFRVSSATAAASDVISISCANEPDCTVVVEEWTGLGTADANALTDCVCISPSTTFSTTSPTELVLVAAGGGATPYTAGSGFTIEQTAPAASETRTLATTVTGATAAINSANTGSGFQFIVVTTFTGGGATPCVPTLAMLGVGGRCG